MSSEAVGRLMETVAGDVGRHDILIVVVAHQNLLIVLLRRSLKVLCLSYTLC